MRRVAVIGGGPAGASAAAVLADRGLDTCLFHVNPAQGDKPCGGGVTWKAGPELLGWGGLRLAGNPVDVVKIVSPRGREVRIESAGRPFFTIYSRGQLDEALRARAERSGARRIDERVEGVTLTPSGVAIRTARQEFCFDAVVGADGAFSRVRRGLGIEIRHELCPAVDELVEGIDPRDGVTIAFFRDLTGYLWVFPRKDLTSVGLVAREGELTGAAMRERVREFLRRRYPRARTVRSTGWAIPAPGLDGPASASMGGPRFALVGDAAGLADPLTGEGIYYAMASGELAGRLLAEGRGHEYPRQVEIAFGAELRAASRYVKRYFRPRFLEAMLWLARHHAPTRGVLAEVLSGSRPYANLVHGRGVSLRVAGWFLRRA